MGIYRRTLDSAYGYLRCRSFIHCAVRWLQSVGQKLMAKFFFYIPLHMYNMYIAILAPRWVIRMEYEPSSETIREQEQAVRNKARLAAYYLKGGK